MQSLHHQQLSFICFFPEIRSYSWHVYGVVKKKPLTPPFNCYEWMRLASWINPMQTQFPCNLHTIWHAVAEHIAGQTSKDTSERWFKSNSITVADENKITLTVANNIYQPWIKAKYMTFVRSSIASMLGSPRTINSSLPWKSFPVRASCGGFAERRAASLTR